MSHHLEEDIYWRERHLLNLGRPKSAKEFKQLGGILLLFQSFNRLDDLNYQEGSKEIYNQKIRGGTNLPSGQTGRRGRFLGITHVSSKQSGP